MTLARTKSFVVVFLMAFSLPCLCQREYHPTTVAKLVSGSFVHTHAEVVGYVNYVFREADGDWHIRLCNSIVPVRMNRTQCVVCEIIPTLRSNPPLAPPSKNSKIRVRGLVRYDKESNHKWWEIHPVEFWEVVK